jgi:hypothetical protein
MKRNQMALMTIAALAATAFGSESGNIDTVDCYSGILHTLQLDEKTFWASWYHTGTRRSNTKGALFDGVTGECAGFLWRESGETKGRGSCKYIDSDGDVAFAQSERQGDEFSWFFAGGTGKFSEISGSGVFTELQYFPRLSDDTYQLCSRTTGEYRLSST